VKTKVEFESIRANDGASAFCFDCRENNPQWASVSNGIFLCLSCAGTHRSLGVHLSFVRSITMDSWSVLQIEKMRAGGNTRLNTFLKRQKFPSKLSAKEKYDNDAMEKYRERLVAIAKGKAPCDIEMIGYQPRQPRTPSKQFSQLQSNSFSSSRNNSVGVLRSMGSISSSFMSGGSGFRKKEKKNDWGFDSLLNTIQQTSSTVASTVAKGTAEVTSKLNHGVGVVGQQVKEKDIGSQLSSGWNFAVGWASKTVKNISDVITEDDGIKLYNKDAVTPSRRKMESKSSKDFFLGGQRGISSNSYLENSSNKLVSDKSKASHNSRRSPMKYTNQNDRQSTSFRNRTPPVQQFQRRSQNSQNSTQKRKNSGFGFSSDDDNEAPISKPVAKPVAIVDDSESFGFSDGENFAQPIKTPSNPITVKEKSGKIGFDSNSFEDILGDINGLSCKKDSNVRLDGDSDENWEW